MYTNIKPLIALSNINSLPDGHLHSKISFLKAIINQQQNPQLKQIKDRMYKMSYTIKNIGIHGEEIGITSKRMPLKQKQQYKQSEIVSDKAKQVYKKKYLPHNTFYSQALIPIKKLKTQDQEQTKSNINNPFLISTSNFNPRQFSQTFHISPQTKFSKKLQQTNKFGRNFSHASKFKSTFNKQSNQKQQQFMQKVTSLKKNSSDYQLYNNKKNNNKKSFAKLLNQFGNQNKDVHIMPIQHQENPMFKKIKKLQELTQKKELQKVDKFRSLRGLSRSSSSFVGRYQNMISTARNINSRRTISKSD